MVSPLEDQTPLALQRQRDALDVEVRALHAERVALAVEERGLALEKTYSDRRL
jgi:hypothetical protein